MTIQVSTKVCSFGKQVVEKVETEYARYQDGRYVYKLDRSPMCEYMINFILKLKNLPEKYMMNSVLENFTILQVINPKRSGNNGVEIALCKPVIETRLDDCRAEPIVRENGTQDKSAHWLDLRSRPPLKTWFVHTTPAPALHHFLLKTRTQLNSGVILSWSCTFTRWTWISWLFCFLLMIVWDPSPAAILILSYIFFSSGDHTPRDPRDVVMHRLRLRGVHIRARSPAPHLQTCQGLSPCSEASFVLAGFRREYKEVLLCSR